MSVDGTGLMYLHYDSSTLHDRHTVSNTHPELNFRVGGRSARFSASSGEKSSPKWEIPCPGRRWTTVQNLTPLALSSQENPVTVQTNKKQTNKKLRTVNDISTPCLSACVDNYYTVDNRSTRSVQYRRKIANTYNKHHTMAYESVVNKWTVPLGSDVGNWVHCRMPQSGGERGE